MFLEKILLGITLAAPIGPVSLEIIRRGLTRGFLAAFLICVGAVIGDGLCLGAAYLGLSSISEYAPVMNGLGLVGAALLLYLGFTNLKNANQQFDFSANTAKTGVFKSILLGFVLAVVNPLSLVFWISIFAASTVGAEEITFLPNSFILVGVLIWSISLCTFLTISKNILHKNFIRVIIMLSSMLLLYYGCKYGYMSVSNLLTL